MDTNEIRRRSPRPTCPCRSESGCQNWIAHDDIHALCDALDAADERIAAGLLECAEQKRCHADPSHPASVCDAIAAALRGGE